MGEKIQADLEDTDLYDELAEIFKDELKDYFKDRLKN